mmetsp:Transcript_12838/g.33023  ORF Transcript_12838/g.33023 Transcript_12838/m.33023 type:complete len:222 (+) Transcript_12838:939-1604(+)
MALCSCLPLSSSMFITVWLPSSAGEGEARRRRTAERKAPPRRACFCTKDGASAASASASTASMDAGSRTMASASLTLMPLCAKRMVAAVVFSLTAPFTMAMACVSADSSSWRTWLLTSQVFALLEHMSESPVRYCWSSSSCAATTERSWLAVAMAACFSAFSFLWSATSFSLPLMKFSFSCMKVLCACTAATSASSTPRFVSLKSTRRPSRVEIMSVEWNL